MGTAIAINTEKLGRLTLTQYRKLVKEHGTKVAFAKSVGVTSSTVRTWGQRLNEKRSARTTA